MAKDTTTTNGDGKHSVSVRLDEAVFMEVKRLADADERSVNQFIERHVRKHFTPTTATGEKSAI